MANAVQMIRRDHKRVAGLFKKFDRAKTSAAKKRIVEQLAKQLDMHSRLEEEIFYPAVRRELGEEDLVEEARKEHQEVKEIVQQLKQMDGEGDRFEATFSELVECIQHHVEEEEGELLPTVEESNMDLTQYGEQMSERKEELTEASRSRRSRGGLNRPPKSGSGRGRTRSAA
jgi:hypothetical protein